MPGTWTDPIAGLMWINSGSNLNWFQASDLCQGLTVGGRAGWRLPTDKELKKMRDPMQNGIDELHIKRGTKIDRVWSSTGYSPSGMDMASHSHGVDNSRIADVKQVVLCVRRSTNR